LVFLVEAFGDVDQAVAGKFVDEFRRIFSAKVLRSFGSMGLRVVKVTGVPLRVALRIHRSARWRRAFS
jgi:hypothetical protein